MISNNTVKLLLDYIEGRPIAVANNLLDQGLEGLFSFFPSTSLVLFLSNVK